MYNLDDDLKKLIKENSIAFTEIAKKINFLARRGTVPFTISHQSISRYMRGAAFPKKETGEIIEKAVREIIADNVIGMNDTDWDELSDNIAVSMELELADYLLSELSEETQNLILAQASCVLEWDPIVFYFIDEAEDIEDNLIQTMILKNVNKTNYPYDSTISTQNEKRLSNILSLHAEFKDVDEEDKVFLQNLKKEYLESGDFISLREKKNVLESQLKNERVKRQNEFKNKDLKEQMQHFEEVLDSTKKEIEKKKDLKIEIRKNKLYSILERFLNVEISLNENGKKIIESNVLNMLYKLILSCLFKKRDLWLVHNFMLLLYIDSENSLNQSREIAIPKIQLYFNQEIEKLKSDN